MSERDVAGDSSYQVNSHDWPIAAQSDVSMEEIVRVLNDFDRYYPDAVKALARTVVPSVAGGKRS